MGIQWVTHIILFKLQETLLVPMVELWGPIEFPWFFIHKSCCAPWVLWLSLGKLQLIEGHFKQILNAFNGELFLAADCHMQM